MSKEFMTLECNMYTGHVQYEFTIYTHIMTFLTMKKKLILPYTNVGQIQLIAISYKTSNHYIWDT